MGYLDGLARASALVLGCWLLGCGARVDEEDDGGCESTDGCGESSGTDTDPLPDPGGYVNCADLPADGPTVAPGEPGPLGFPETACNPRADNGGEYVCCSDDPAATEGTLPGYVGGVAQGGTPIFSGNNNALGTSGMCVRTSDLPAGVGLAEPAAANCPIPCNPTWDGADVSSVCGAGRVCCQTRVIQPEDCVLDDGGNWRPARGEDVLAGRSSWAPDSHATHQDPTGQGCAVFAGGNDPSNPDFTDCIEQLSVADQRGYCMALAVGQGCPGEGELDACAQINMGLIPPPV